MDFTIKRRNIKPTHTGSLVELYPHDLQLYRIPPINNITLQEFEELAIERLKVLRTLATVTTLKGFKLFSKEWKAAVIEELQKEGLKGYSQSCKSAGFTTSEADLQARRRDHISHFILRLAYCRSEELRKWFTTRELELFKMRFMSLKPEGVKTFLTINNLQYVPITQDEKTDILSNLYESTTSCSHVQVEMASFYKVKFSEVFDLVKMRRVYLQGGFAYIPSSDFVSVMSSQYRAHLNQALAVASRRLPEVEHDERLVFLLKGLHNSYTGNDYSNTSKSVLPIESLDGLSGKAYPLCMRQLHEHLRNAHHMKHGGRIQYGLFLKAAGVTLEDSLRFWREEFTKLMDLDKFEKQYAYNVRYNYGKEGSRKNYSAYSCMKIIQGNPGAGDVHGCPFKHSDPSILKTKLLGYGMNPLAINTIVDLAKQGHYQVACSKYFDITNNVHIELGVNHPNQYFEESQNISAGQGKPNIDNIVKTERTYVYNTQNSQNISMKDESTNHFEGDFDEQFTEADLSMMEDMDH